MNVYSLKRILYTFFLVYSPCLVPLKTLSDFTCYKELNEIIFTFKSCIKDKDKCFLLSLGLMTEGVATLAWEEKNGRNRKILNVFWYLWSSTRISFFFYRDGFTAHYNLSEWIMVFYIFISSIMWFFESWFFFVLFFLLKSLL